MNILNIQTGTLKAVIGKLRIKQLQLLIALSEHKSLHKAAGAMFLTQSAASKALQEIEGMLEVTLFERTRVGLVPNAMGHCAIRYAKLITTELNNLCREVSDIQSGTGGRLAIGTIMGAIPDMLVSAMQWLRTAHSALSIEIIEGTSRDLLNMLDDGQLDLVIGRTSVSPEPYEYNYYPISDEPISVVAGGRHPDIENDLPFESLRDYRWVVYPKHMPLRVLLEQEMDLAGLALPVNVIETASTFATIALLQKTVDLVALLPTDVARMFAQAGMIKILPIAQNIPANTFGIVTRKGGMPTAVAELFIRAVREQSLAH
ncbi:MAG: LysR family transcriptional regulator [Alcaligenaceae bacterium]|nr:LysR family transcriptional regulator [Alcaligenaceae bacterium]